MSQFTRRVDRVFCWLRRSSELRRWRKTQECWLIDIAIYTTEGPNSHPGKARGQGCSGNQRFSHGQYEQHPPNIKQRFVLCKSWRNSCLKNSKYQHGANAVKGLGCVRNLPTLFQFMSVFASRASVTLILTPTYPGNFTAPKAYPTASFSLIASSLATTSPIKEVFFHLHLSDERKRSRI